MHAVLVVFSFSNTFPALNAWLGVGGGLAERMGGGGDGGVLEGPLLPILRGTLDGKRPRPLRSRGLLWN